MQQTRNNKHSLKTGIAIALLLACLVPALLQTGCRTDYVGCLGEEPTSSTSTPTSSAGGAQPGETSSEVPSEEVESNAAVEESSGSASAVSESSEPENAEAESPEELIQLDTIPAYAGELFVEVNGNTPFFNEEDRARGAFEEYSELDDLGRAGVAFALISRDTMPTEERQGDLQYKPTGWQVSTYDFVDYHFLYNRCHLIAWSLAAEGDNPQNLITGTRTLNMEGMRPFEEQVSRYVYRTNNSVLYRVTPIYWGDNLVASGVLMEAESLEDGGEGLRFCVYCYNAEPGVSINYATGENQADGTKVAQEYVPSAEEAEADFVINRRSQVYHYPDCEALADTRDYNKIYFQGTFEELQEEYPDEEGWRLCNMCRENHGA